jgi:hypothetical protein
VSNPGICKMVTFDNGTTELLDETLDINVKAPYRSDRFERQVIA